MSTDWFLSAKQTLDSFDKPDVLVTFMLWPNTWQRQPKEEGLVLGHCQEVFIHRGTEGIAGMAGDWSVWWSILQSEQTKKQRLQPAIRGGYNLQRLVPGDISTIQVSPAKDFAAFKTSPHTGVKCSKAEPAESSQCSNHSTTLMNWGC